MILGESLLGIVLGLWVWAYGFGCIALSVWLWAHAFGHMLLGVDVWAHDLALGGWFWAYILDV